MDELSVQSMARKFVSDLDLSCIHEDLAVYVSKVKAKVTYEELDDGESGYTIPMRGGASSICINSRESMARQRFTICHEIAHLVLDLASNHEEIPSWSYAKKHENEMWCDMFAAELLMPYEQFRADVRDSEPSFQLIDTLKTKYQTSFPATGSRIAAVSDYPCAFVTMDKGMIRYASRSTALRGLNAWVTPRTPIPSNSVAHRLWSTGESYGESSDISQDIWFSDWVQGYDLNEMARHYPDFQQTFSLIWFDTDDGPAEPVKSFTHKTEATEGLAELTGELPWPGKRRRK